MTIRKALVCSLAIFLLLGLGSHLSRSAGLEPESPGRPGESADKAKPTWNDYARLIAGLSDQESSLAAYEKQPAWLSYASRVNQNWRHFDRQRLSPIREWASRELGAVNADTVFYPFSGPDFINLYAFFPRAKTYFMVALEPVGEIPDFSAVEAKNFFDSLQGSLYELLHLDFFRTDKLKTSLKNQELRGTLPVLLFFLARENVQVLEVRYWAMRADGAIEETTASDPGNPGRHGIRGVQIVFKRAGSAGNQTLYYFRVNLRNNSLKQNPRFIAFLKSFGPFTTFAKAASYLMFKDGYSTIRQFILEQSDYVVQTDSAIPLKYFTPSRWNLSFYGTYTGPIMLFNNRFQSDLAKVYQQAKGIQPLPFGIGYRHRLNTSNLMYAAKKAEILASDAK